jgi:hypothetical protein
MLITQMRLWFLLVGLFLFAGCGSGLPEDVEGYEDRCVKLNGDPIPPYAGDPHRGMKNVFACNVDLGLVQSNTRPFPDGALIVKESTREGTDYRWLVATARKQGGTWSWDEYTRNFSDEELRRIPVAESKCTGCHVRVKAIDWIYTHYLAR